MTLRGAIWGVRQLMLGDRRQRQEARYRMALKFRRIDLGGATLEQLGLSADHSKPYSNSGGPELDSVLKALSIRPSDSIVDLGCGKGGAMLTLAKYPFRRVDGIEISNSLCRTAEHNLRRAGVRNSVIYCCDAGAFQNFDSYTYIYMYNPFPEAVMQVVMENIRHSLERAPRELFLIYKNPICDASITTAGFRRVMQFDQLHLPIQVYSAGAA